MGCVLARTTDSRRMLVRARPYRPMNGFHPMRRILWHLFGAAASAIFAVGSASLIAGNLTIQMSPWGWAVVTAVGFVAMLPYVQWYRNG